jgi:hypothetical protein
LGDLNRELRQRRPVVLSLTAAGEVLSAVQFADRTIARMYVRIEPGDADSN